MKIDFDSSDLRPLITEIVAEVRAQDDADQAKVNGRLAYRECEAAALLGVASHTVRDARRRGELTGSKVGKYIVYTRDELLELLRRNRIT